MIEMRLRQTLAASGIPDYMHDGLVLYLIEGISPGHFLLAVLSNDLYGAVSRADANNGRCLSEYLRWLNQHAPFEAWGSPERVVAWMDGRATKIG